MVVIGTIIVGIIHHIIGVDTIIVGILLTIRMDTIIVGIVPTIRMGIIVDGIDHIMVGIVIMGIIIMVIVITGIIHRPKEHMVGAGRIQVQIIMVDQEQEVHQVRHLPDQVILGQVIPDLQRFHQQELDHQVIRVRELQHREVELVQQEPEATLVQPQVEVLVHTNRPVKEIVLQNQLIQDLVGHTREVLQQNREVVQHIHLADQKVLHRKVLTEDLLVLEPNRLRVVTQGRQEAEVLQLVALVDPRQEVVPL